MINWILISALCMKANFGQVVSSHNRQLTFEQLQQCTADMACGHNYAGVFQTKLDNASHYLELELALLRHQTANAMVPLLTGLQKLETNYSVQIAGITGTLEQVVQEIVYDRQFLGNLTRGLYILNDEFHKESMVRYHDVHELVTELNSAKKNITSLQAAVNLLFSHKPLSDTNQGTSSNALSCTDKDHEISNLRNNLTYYMNAYNAAESALETVHAQEAYLQTHVSQLAEDLSKADASNRIKDHLISSLTNQINLLQTSHSSLPPNGTCTNELGMRNGQIPANYITASDSQLGREPSFARLDNSQGWFTPDRSTSNDYLQIDTGSDHFITQVATQGAPCCNVMVTNYTLQYSDDGLKWHDYRKDCVQQYFHGNVDQDGVVRHTIDPPIRARFIRFNVVSFKKIGGTNYVGMRVELYGCSR